MDAHVGIMDRNILDTPVAVFDFETTGLSPGMDRVIEVSVIRCDPGERPRIAFDTLINPGRRVSATEIHGITNRDVADAPTFEEIAGDLVGAMEGCALAAYNVYFDMKFLDYELDRAGVAWQPPHFCLMYLRPMLGLGKQCRLDIACREYGVPFEGEHIAANDALASALLYEHYLGEIRNQNLATFSDLARLKKYKFTKSFGNAPLPHPAHMGLNLLGKTHSRANA
jgi:DNA polymerase III subunit epsilon